VETFWKIGGEIFSSFADNETTCHRTIINNLFTIVKRKNHKDFHKVPRFLLRVDRVGLNYWNPWRVCKEKLSVCGISVVKEDGPKNSPMGFP
jgi:hypothetical protein